MRSKGLAKSAFLGVASVTIGREMSKHVESPFGYAIGYTIAGLYLRRHALKQAIANHATVEGYHA